MKISTLNELHNLEAGAYKFIIFNDTKKSLIDMFIGRKMMDSEHIPEDQLIRDLYYHHDIVRELSTPSHMKIIGGGWLRMNYENNQTQYRFYHHSDVYGPIPNELIEYLIHKHIVQTKQELKNLNDFVKYENPNHTTISLEHNNQLYQIQLAKPSTGIYHKDNPWHIDNIPQEHLKAFLQIHS